MRDVVLNKMMNFVNDGSYSKEQLEKIHYGFECIFIFITKGLIIFFIAFLLGILKHTLFFVAVFGFLRMFGCGIHAKTSISCLIASILLFIIFPYLCIILKVSRMIRL